MRDDMKRAILKFTAIPDHQLATAALAMIPILTVLQTTLEKNPMVYSIFAFANLLIWVIPFI